MNTILRKPNKNLNLSDFRILNHIDISIFTKPTKLNFLPKNTCAVPVNFMANSNAAIKSAHRLTL